MKTIAEAFDNAQQKQSAALMPYLTLGYPNRQASLEAVRAIAPYCDLIELGVPFSDPLADGPTIQRSTQISLENGTTSADCLQMVRELRAGGVENPFMLMGYYNPILAYGEQRYVQDCVEAGVNGLIVPDLPPEEAETLATLCKNAGIHLIYFLALTSSPERIASIIGKATGFIYMVSVVGITGARTGITYNLPDFVSQIKSQTNTPVAVGFGISTPQQAQAVGDFADGVIVGSALINALDNANHDPQAGATFVKALQQALVAGR